MNEQAKSPDHAPIAPRKKWSRWAKVAGILCGFGVLLIAFLILYAAGHMQGSRVDRDEFLVSALSLSLENYKIDHDEYPRSEATDRLLASRDFNPKNYIAASKYLYLCLNPKGGKFYIDTEFKSMIRTDATGESYFVDSHGNSIGYSTAGLVGSGTNSKSGPGFFDLWSTGGGTKEKHLNRWKATW